MGTLFLHNPFIVISSVNNSTNEQVSRFNTTPCCGNVVSPSLLIWDGACKLETGSMYENLCFFVKNSIFSHINGIKALAKS